MNMLHPEQAIQTAIVGLGLSSTVFHIPFIQCSDAFELVAISSSQKETIQRSFPTVTQYDCAQTMINDSSAELIIICAPSSEHYRLAHYALSQGKHVIIEKPFVTQLEQGQSLLELATQQNKILAAFHNRRWDGDFLTLKQLINSNELGEVKYFESHFDRFRPQVRERWREQPGEGAGILFDLGPHLIDQALSLFGMPEAITARCLASRNGSQVTDFFNLWLHYHNKEVVLQSSPYVASPTLRFHLQGTHGNYLKHGIDPQEDRLRAGVLPNHPHWGQETEEQYGVLHHESGQRIIPTVTGGYQHFFENVAAAINGYADLIITPQEALNCIKIIEVAQHSSEQGRTLNV
jgi:predicted dehydrogenase